MQRLSPKRKQRILSSRVTGDLDKQLARQSAQVASVGAKGLTKVLSHFVQINDAIQSRPLSSVNPNRQTRSNRMTSANQSFATARSLGLNCQAKSSLNQERFMSQNKLSSKRVGSKESKADNEESPVNRRVNFNTLVL